MQRAGPVCESRLTMTYLRREPNLQRGAAAERRAGLHLEAQGLRLMTRNYRCRMGEIDLVMQDGAAVVFVEVRLRGRNALVSAAESIDAHKQSRLIAAAHHYLMTHARAANAPCRFDCVLMTSQEDGQIEWIKSAFTL